MQNPRPRPVWLGHCLLSRLELNHGAFQLPGALQMKDSSKHDNKRKLGRWIPREGRSGASTEQTQTLRSGCSRWPEPARPPFLLLSPLLSPWLLALSQPSLAGHCPWPAFHKLKRQSCHQLTWQLFGSEVSPYPVSSSEPFPSLSLAAQSVYALRQIRQSVSRELFSRRSRA